MKSKKQRTPGMSISVKLNMLVIAIVFIVSVLLILISNSAYRRAVFKSQEIKLNGIEFPDIEEVVPMLDHLQRIFETEEFQNARAEFRPGTKDAEGSSAMAAWMDTQPGWYQLESGAGSMLFDWLIVAEYADIFWENNALKSVRIDVQKDGKAWHIYERAINEEDTIKFDYVGEAATWYPESETDSFRSAALTQIGDSHLCLRCIRDKMEGGGEYCIWAAVDMSDEVTEYQRFQITSLLSLVGLTILINAFMMYVLRRMITGPISLLAGATQAFVPETDGTYSAERITRVRIHSRDELGNLSRDIQNMQEQIVENTENLARMTAERERTNAELDLARSIQASVLPSVFPPFPERSEFVLYASMEPAKAVGGDFYDFFMIDEDHLCLLIADVSDKGVPAALFMMSAKILLNYRARMGGWPAEILRAINAQISRENPEKMFVTVWIGILDVNTGVLTCSNAGHEYPAVRGQDGVFRIFRDKHGIMVAAMANTKYSDYELLLKPGDAIFVYTDGVPDAQNASGEVYGMVRLEKALNRTTGQSPEGVLRAVRSDIDTFVNGANQFDDLTMLCLEYRGKLP